MLLSALIDTAQFGLQVLFVTVSIALILIVLFNLIYRLKDNDKEDLEIKDLNKQFSKAKWSLKSKVLREKTLKNEQKEEKKKSKKLAEDRESQPRVWVIDFDGDIQASATENLRTEVSSILQIANKKDEVVIRLQSPGGAVPGYGFAASQLQRIKDHGTRLTICVDKVAASGGYMMACLADEILAAPFAIVGSIGVVAQVPNLNKLLTNNSIDYQEYTAGEYKRTISILAANTEQGIEKFKTQLNETHDLFKNWVHKFRPALEIDKVATGEYWYGQQAIDLGLVDRLSTSDQYLMEKLDSHRIISVRKSPKKPFHEKFLDASSNAVSASVEKWMHQKTFDWINLR